MNKKISKNQLLMFWTAFLNLCLFTFDFIVTLLLFQKHLTLISQLLLFIPLPSWTTKNRTHSVRRYRHWSVQSCVCMTSFSTHTKSSHTYSQLENVEKRESIDKKAMMRCWCRINGPSSILLNLILNASRFLVLFTSLQQPQIYWSSGLYLPLLKLLNV